ncbi:MAG: DUF6798 domain-containing protein [Synechococcales bacterium]|nr:DUF6798 domain-containing protein [Synechococcales bacterium]
METQAALKSVQGVKWRRWGGAIAQFLLVALIFGIAYTQDAIFHSPENQNTKYLIGLARGGYGLLQQDWMVGTLDPLPVFTALVQVTYQFLHAEYAFYAYYFLIFGVYVYSLVGIVSQVYPLRNNRVRLGLFFALFLIVHCLHLEMFDGDFDLGWHLHAGVAQQYILGPVFQPANFGAFLLLSIERFLRGHTWVAVPLLALAATFHPAYFPSVGVLTLAYMAVLAWRRHFKAALGVGMLSTVLILPVLSYMLVTFQDTTPALAAQAADIIVNQRIPHHSIPAEWLDIAAYIQVGVVAIALLLTRRHLLFPILAIPYATAVFLTGLQMVINNDFVAFIAPWRISVFLVPIATSLILAWGVTAVTRRWPRWCDRHQIFLVRASLVVILTTVIFGGLSQIEKWTMRDETVSMMTFVRDTKQPGEVYLIPPDVEDLRKFRLFTGAPIFINRKTHPYKDVEVIEWNQRLERAKAFYEVRRPPQQCRLLKREFRKDGVTHVVLPQGLIRRRCPTLTELYQDDHYGVYEISARR